MNKLMPEMEDMKVISNNFFKETDKFITKMKNNQKKQDFENLSKLINDFIQKYCNPHTKIIAENGCVELVEGVMCKNFEIND